MKLQKKIIVATVVLMLVMVWVIWPMLFYPKQWDIIDSRKSKTDVRGLMESDFTSLSSDEVDSELWVKNYGSGQWVLRVTYYKDHVQSIHARYESFLFPKMERARNKYFHDNIQ